MNLFVKTLDSYLKKEWSETQRHESGSREARFIVQSIGPSEVFKLFSSLEEYKCQQQQQHSLKCYFRVASGLWKDWCKEEGQEEKLQKVMEDHGAIGENNERLWIDEEDKLTWYRNRTVSDEKVDTLIVVLVGLNHATDQGGLSDFHIIDDSGVWAYLQKSFKSWIEAICDHRDIAHTAGPTHIENLEKIFQQLFEIRPLQLSKLARFIEEKLLTQSYTSVEQMQEQLLAELPYWGIPPILNVSTFSSNVISLIKNADRFTSHQQFKNKLTQKKEWAKIEKWLEDPLLDLPTATSSEFSLNTVDEYRDILQRFIFRADASAKRHLLKLDIRPLLDTLARKEPKKRSSKKSIKSFKGFALESVLQGIEEAISDFKKLSESQALVESLQSIHVEVISFEHDMLFDEGSSLGGRDLAEILLVGCLGGLEQVFAELDCRFPKDEEEALLRTDNWSVQLPITFSFDKDSVLYKASRSNPRVKFKVEAVGFNEEEAIEQLFYWQLSPTQSERVFVDSIRFARTKWEAADDPAKLMPAFQIPEVNMTALYYAADETEANRLVSQSMTDMEILNLLEGCGSSDFAASLNLEISKFILAYRDWLEKSFNDGFHSALFTELSTMLQKYVALAEMALDKNLLGSSEFLRRFYKAFFIVDQHSKANDAYLQAGVAWGLSPAVLEQIKAKVRFLIDGFPEVIAKLALGEAHSETFDRLIDLSQIHRPIAGLVTEENQLTADLSSYGLIHYLGAEPTSEMSLAVQTLLRESDEEDGDNIKEAVRPCQETKAVSRVFEQYLSLYPHAHDGIRVLAVNVKELQTILSGLQHFLTKYLKHALPGTSLPQFHLYLMVYTSSSSPMVMEKLLSAWREQLNETFDGKFRGLKVTVGHKFASHENLEELLKKERLRYDIAFLFHFLKDGLVGRADLAQPYKFAFDNCSFFPIAEHPRPVNAGDASVRYNLISNRRLRAQTRHGDMSARLCFGGSQGYDHIIFGKVDFQPWKKTIEALHGAGHWIICVDPFVDKKLLSDDEDLTTRIVGFASGLGTYGELNLTISTQQDTLKQLTKKVADRLNMLFSFESTESVNVMAVRIVKELENIVGLSSISAVIGEDQRVRDVIGFAAIRRALQIPRGHMSQFVPLDDMQHWYTDNDTNMRQDLLQLTLEMRDNDVPLIHANLVECKLALKSEGHVEKAYEQIQSGLQYLPILLAPKVKGLNTIDFDRRYWWAQLHRAISSRASVNLPENEWRNLDHALENIAEGLYEIHWRASIFTFWTDDDSIQPAVNQLLLPAGTIEAPFVVDDNFTIQHISVGYKVLTSLFEEERPTPLLKLSESKISLKPSANGSDFNSDIKKDVGDAESDIDSTVLNQEDTSSESLESAPLAGETSDTAKIMGETERELSKLDLEEKSTTVNSINTEQVDASIMPTSDEGVKLSFCSNDMVPTFKVPDKVLIGTRRNGEPVYWHFGHPKLANRHMLIFGTSGSGKTYGIQCLLSELAAQSVRSFIIDYTDGFKTDQVEPEFDLVGKPANYYVRMDQLPLNPFKRQLQVVDPNRPAIEESSFYVASRITSIFTSVYPTMGDQQSAALNRALTKGLDSDQHFSFDQLLPLLRAEGKQGESLANKLQPFVESKLFCESQNNAWEEMLIKEGHWVHVLQLTALSQDIQKIVTEFTLWDLWDYVQNFGNKNKPIPVVLDEIHNLDHSSDSPINKILREGRKFGLSMILATQTTSDFNQEQRDRLFQAGHKLFFKPASTEVDRFAQVLSQATAGISRAEWVQRLNKLEKGQCWSLGPVEKSNGALVDEPVLVSVTALTERGFGT
jgi:DNA phosphorothioation-dependent restriction protein DptH